MPLQAQQQTEQNRISGFLSRYTYLVIAITLFSGMAIGYFAAGNQRTATSTKPQMPPTVNVLIHDGVSTRSWNNISLLEGDSAAIVLDRIAKIEGIPIAWSDDSKDRSLTSLQEKDTVNGKWEFYMNNTIPLMTIGRFYPNDSDTISLIYTKNNAQ